MGVHLVFFKASNRTIAEFANTIGSDKSTTAHNEPSYLIYSVCLLVLLIFIMKQIEGRFLDIFLSLLSRCFKGL